MDRACAVCGETFSAKRPSAKYCGERCRKRAQRRPDGVKASAGPVETPTPEIPVGLVASTVAELARAGRETSALGQSAILLAYRLEYGASGDTGSSVAALVKQHNTTLAEALKGAEKASAIDELKARRDAKRAG